MAFWNKRKKTKDERDEDFRKACHKEFKSALDEAVEKERNRIIDGSKKLIWTMRQLRRTDSALSMKVQGKHPETGGTVVIYFDTEKYEKLHEAKYMLQCILFGKPNEEVNQFIDRVERKVVKGYANQIEVNGRDDDGDSIEYELKFKTQNHLIDFLKTGIFDWDNPDHNEFLLVGIEDIR